MLECNSKLNQRKVGRIKWLKLLFVRPRTVRTSSKAQSTYTTPKTTRLQLTGRGWRYVAAEHHQTSLFVMALIPRLDFKPRRQLIQQVRNKISCLLIALVVFAAVGNPARFTFAFSARKTLRVMSYNIHVGVGMDQKMDLERIAAVINHEKPDLVGLQEVDRGVRRTQGVDEIVELSKLTKMNYAFAPNLDYQGGVYGVAILSRFPIGTIDHRKFQNRRESERRGMLGIEVEVAGQTVNFVTSHLDYQYADGRLFEAEQLLRALDGLKGPVILVGDLNDEPAGDAYKLMTSKFQDAWITSKTKEDGFSYPADKVAKRIDYIFFRMTDAVKAKKAWTVHSLASDHVPVVVELELNF
jgi:endonuclease/exonuclease/phosphatase family metal-dependent hydrolase